MQVNLMSPVTLHDISSMPKGQPYSEANPSLHSSHVNSSLNGRKRSLSKSSSIINKLPSNGHSNNPSVSSSKNMTRAKQSPR